MDTELMQHGDPSVEVQPNLLSPGDHIWAGPTDARSWKRVDRVEYRPGGWAHNGLGHPTAERPGFHIIFCVDGWEQVVVRGDEIEVRIGHATGRRSPSAPDGSDS